MFPTTVYSRFMPKSIADIRNHAAASLSTDKQQMLEQFLTPMEVAVQAVSLFSESTNPLNILDLGSGSGILSAVTAQHSPSGSTVTAIEQDKQLADLSEAAISQGTDKYEIINESVFDVSIDARFDRVILNPPYKKIKPTYISTDCGQIKVTNLYAAFLVTAIEALAPNGECVAIIPRSWMNGLYFSDLRHFLLEKTSIDAMAVYGSRREHFEDMGILQEIMLLKLSRKTQRKTVTVYQDVSAGTPLIKQDHHDFPIENLVFGKEKIVRIQQQDPRLNQFRTLSENGLWASTGKLVCFRNRDIISEKTTSYPLYWAANQKGLVTVHPVTGTRGQWVSADAENRPILQPAGSFVFVNRFTSKEQHRRIHATYLNNPGLFAADNKLNYIHAGTPRKTVPLQDAVARGLTVWLATTIVDDWYREVSGNTQVNATDLRQLPCPSQDQLAALANLINPTNETDQKTIDETVERFFSWTPRNK